MFASASFLSRSAMAAKCVISSSRYEIKKGNFAAIYNSCLKKEKLVECGNKAVRGVSHTVQCSLELGLQISKQQAIFQRPFFGHFKLSSKHKESVLQ